MKKKKLWGPIGEGRDNARLDRLINTNNRRVKGVMTPLKRRMTLFFLEVRSVYFLLARTLLIVFAITSS